VAIKAVAMDVDGVLTDGSVWFDESGRESKRLSFADIMGVSIGRRAGLSFALVSGEGGALLDVIAAKLGITHVYPNCRDKAAAVRDFASRHDLQLGEVCFMGDDVNDVPALQICGFAVAPAGSHASALAAAAFATARRGGEGAVRELVEYLTTQPRPDLPGRSADRST
jgi:3-deoxy-D-manno-octulosonate 8-phosphate phosphatase (KDO 8-P phosphatase)